MWMTMAQKIIARASGRDHVAPGDYIWGKVDGTGVIGGSALRHLDNLGKVFDPERVYVVEDHLAPSPSVVAANGTKRMREFVKRNGIKNYFEWGRHGILHELFPDHGYCSPGATSSPASTPTPPATAASTWPPVRSTRRCRSCSSPGSSGCACPKPSSST